MIRNIILGALLLAPLSGICQKATKTKKVIAQTAVIDYKAIGSPLPPLRIITEKREVITNATVAGNSNLIIMMFNPTCGHCEEMTRAIEENIELFKTTPVLLVSAAGMFIYLEYFQKNVKAANFPKIKIGVDSSGYLDKSFNYSGLPQVNIYNADRKLIKTFSTITTIDSIRQYIQ